MNGDASEQNTRTPDVVSKAGEQKQSVRSDLIDLMAKRIVKQIDAKSKTILEDVKDQLPKTSEEVRKLPFYDSTLDAIRYQRDNYLVGTKYANRRQRQRSQGIPPPPVQRMPYHATALGNIQIISLGASFIPSPTVKNLLLPLVVSLPSGVLKDTITDAVADAIPLAQPLVDHAVKSSLLSFINSPQMRQVIKNRAGGYMSNRNDTSTPPEQDDPIET